MATERDDEVRTSDAEAAPRGGMPGDGAGRIEDPGTSAAGVWPVSGPPSGNPDATIHDMASFGQGERGAAGYADHGDSEVRTVPPGGAAAEARSGAERGEAGGPPPAGPGRPTRAGAAVGAEGSNAGEVDPGIGGSGETVGEVPGGAGEGAGLGNAVGGGGPGDVPATSGTDRG